MINFLKDLIFILGGVKYIIFFTFFGFIGGLLIGLLIVIINGYDFLKPFTKIYISLFRGIPLICQIGGFIYFLPDFFSSLMICLMVVALNTGAYLSEVFRAFIDNYNQDKLELAIGMGLTKNQIMRFIIIPQMLRASLPLFTAEMVSIAKDVSILSIFGIMEIFTRSNIIANTNYNYGRSMVLVAVVYYIITFLISRIEHLNFVKKIFNK
jgi:His/Glu/Gln/Arg/opine family amino acid ABC transporter permease subunit